MTTVLKLQSRLGHSSSYTVPAVHSALEPKLVLQRRTVPVGNKSILEDTFTVLDATTDANGAILASKISFSATVKRPKEGDAGDVTLALARFRDIVAGDEFAAMVNYQDNLA
jgi:hypothetical protein